MALSTKLKTGINRVLERANLQLETLTLEKAETRRLLALDSLGYFKEMAFPIPECFKFLNLDSIARELSLETLNFDHFEVALTNDVGYTLNNCYYTSPDAEVLYSIIRRSMPRTIVEIGCGNSTKIIRQAITDGELATQLVSIDPSPRVELQTLPDKIYLAPVESLRDNGLFKSLNKNDILFIDSSHEVKTGNDVVFLFLNILPNLQPGVLVHIHDIFLPFEYPRKWVIEERWGWNEQYLVHVILSMGNMFEVVWAGHYLQRISPNFKEYFPHLGSRVAKSLWLRKVR